MTEPVWLELKGSWEGLMAEAGMRLWQDKAFGVYLVSKQRWSGEAEVGSPGLAVVCRQLWKGRITRGEFSNFTAS